MGMISIDAIMFSQTNCQCIVASYHNDEAQFPSKADCAAWQVEAKAYL